MLVQEEEEQEKEIIRQLVQEGKIKTTKYANKVPPLSRDQSEKVKQSLKSRGFIAEYPILINRNGDILDGHHRYWYSQELGIEPVIEVISQEFKSELEEELFVFDINRARRQLTAWQDAELVLKEKPILARLAKLNMSLGGKGSRIQETLHVDKELAKMSGHTKYMLHVVDYVNKAVQECPLTELPNDYDGRFRGISGPTYARVLEDAREGKIKPAKAYKIIKHCEQIISKLDETRAAAVALELPSKVTLLNKDSTKEIPEIRDNSVDLVVTDPPYAKDSLALFDGLARFAATKLKEGGSLVFYYGRCHQPEIHEVFAKYREQLSWWWSLCVNHQVGHSNRIHDRGIRVGWKPMMWFVKGNKRLTGYDVYDYIDSTKPDKLNHPWAQSSVEAEYLIKNLTLSQDSLVLDPFLGSGAFAIPAIKLGRYFIGIEKDKQVFENAVNNIKAETGIAEKA
jgi:DNA modification methylase